MGNHAPNKVPSINIGSASCGPVVTLQKSTLSCGDCTGGGSLFFKSFLFCFSPPPIQVSLKTPRLTSTVSRFLLFLPSSSPLYSVHQRRITNHHHHSNQKIVVNTPAATTKKNLAPISLAAAATAISYHAQYTHRFTLVSLSRSVTPLSCLLIPAKMRQNCQPNSSRSWVSPHDPLRRLPSGTLSVETVRPGSPFPSLSAPQDACLVSTSYARGHCR